MWLVNAEDGKSQAGRCQSFGQGRIRSARSDGAGEGSQVWTEWGKHDLALARNTEMTHLTLGRVCSMTQVDSPIVHRQKKSRTVKPGSIVCRSRLPALNLISLPSTTPSGEFNSRTCSEPKRAKRGSLATQLFSLPSMTFPSAMVPATPGSEMQLKKCPQTWWKTLDYLGRTEHLIESPIPLIPGLPYWGCPSNRWACGSELE